MKPISSTKSSAQDCSRRTTSDGVLLHSCRTEKGRLVSPAALTSNYYQNCNGLRGIDRAEHWNHGNPMTMNVPICPSPFVTTPLEYVIGTGCKGVTPQTLYCPATHSAANCGLIVDETTVYKLPTASPLIPLGRSSLLQSSVASIIAMNVLRRENECGWIMANDRVPSLLISVGAVDPQRFAAAQQSGSVLPGTHSSLWAPDYRRAIPTAMQAEITLLLEVLGR